MHNNLRMHLALISASKLLHVGRNYIFGENCLTFCKLLILRVMYRRKTWAVKTKYMKKLDAAEMRCLIAGRACDERDDKTDGKMTRREKKMRESR